MVDSSHSRSPRQADMHSRKPARLSISSSSSLSPRLGVLTRPLLSPKTPLSPSLPSLIPRHGKKVPVRAGRLVWKFLLPLISVVLILWAALRFIAYGPGFLTRFPFQGSTTISQTPQKNPQLGQTGYEIVGEDALPDHPTTLIVDDKEGNPRWTISIPEKFEFPLEPHWYRELCEQSHDMPHHLEEVANGEAGHQHGQARRSQPSVSSMLNLLKKRHSYYMPDKSFMDVDEAEKEGLLPKSASLGTGEVCERSLTYVLESNDAGFGKALMGLWLAYGLAEKENRAFFVDDTRWAYGNYTTFFQAAPTPDCLPPPASHRLPCPNTARHKVISSITHTSTFGHSFVEEFENPKGMGMARQKNIFGMARKGYEALFKLADAEDQKYVDERVKKIIDQTREEGGMAVGMHIRRGDRHPLESQYRHDYLPLTRYTDEAREVLYQAFEDAPEAASDLGIDPHTRRSRNRKSRSLFTGALFRSAYTKRHGAPGLSESKLIIASDDPDVYFEPEVVRATPAQDRIRLGSKSQMEAAQGKPKRPWIDNVLGWEGGFYADVFWSLGSDHESKKRIVGGPRPNRERPVTKKTTDPKAPAKLTDSAPQLPRNPSKSSSPYIRGVHFDFHTPSSDASTAEAPEYAAPTLETFKVREMLARSYMLDLSILSQCDAVVCAVSSAGCRLLGVMVGWEDALGMDGLDWDGHAWRNVDAGIMDWRGIVW